MKTPEMPQQGQEFSQSTHKKIKINNSNGDDGWIIVKKKTTPLTISISDHSKVNRFYGHKSIQKYIRYLLTKTCPNPMWLAIKRQSQIEHIYYIDIEIQDYLFDKMLDETQNSEIPFLSEMIKFENRAVFKDSKLTRYVWDSLLIYDQEVNRNQELYKQFISQSRQAMSKQTYLKYTQYLLTPQEMQENLYPNLSLPLYKDYHRIPVQKKENQQLQFNKSLILVIDCEMVTTAVGFELARCTIINYQQEVVFDGFFKPPNPILNYNTEFSGITQQILDPITDTIEGTLHPFLSKTITKQTILVGHSLQNDFNAMNFFHDKVLDSSVLFKRKNGTKMKLKSLADKLLKRKIQCLTHDSKQDCLATLHLVQLRIENQDSIQMNKQYHLLADLVKQNHSALFVDHQIDSKTQPEQKPSKICELIAKYSRKSQMSVPKVIFSRFQKPSLFEWEEYYQNIDVSLKALYDKIPVGSVFFLNFQINETVRIEPFSKLQNKQPRTRPFLALITKSFS